MGYYITTHKEDETLDPIASDFLIATDEEMKVARLAFHSECDDALMQMKEALPEALSTIVYKRFLVYYIRQVQQWMNTKLGYHVFGSDYRPSEREEAVRCIFIRAELLRAVEAYQEGDEARLSKNEYFFYAMSDDKTIEAQKKFQETKNKPTEDGLIPVGATAFQLIDYKKILPVTVTDRKGFMYYCETEDGHPYILPSHQLFRTAEAAREKISERNHRRNAAIDKYHLLEHSEDESVNNDRKAALDWLYFNQDPPVELLERMG